jgi:hypothetical protein
MINIINSSLFPIVGKYLLILLPIFLPLILIYAVWIMRFRWLTLKWAAEQKTCLLEIRLPKEITKSPAAMEIFFSYLDQSGAGNLGEAYIDGKTRPCFSCELVSIDGYVKFFIYCSQAKYRNIIEAQLYAQYPNVEIFEADDYTKDFFYDPEKYSMFGLQFALKEPDPFPIKTYIDYDLDADQKEEYKIDPITSVIEYLGSMKKGENAWIQILIQKHEKESWEHGVLKSKVDPKKANFFEKLLINIFGSSRNLKDEVKAEIKKIKEASLPEVPKGDEQTTFRFPNPTKGQQERIAALERSATKTPFECMIRGIYIANKDIFSPANISGLIGTTKQYSSLDLNGFKPGLKSDVSDLRKDWARIIPFYKDHNDKEIDAIKKDLFHAYKLRSFFQWPYKYYGGRPFILTTEELATIFHFPSGLVSQTPTLQRVGSKKSEAPSNLPI